MEEISRNSPDPNGGKKDWSVTAAVAPSEPVRSRWTPKPEQILILESIFNSGMVNPPKDETVRIRKLLEKFGTVGDANVFYWFQNRRSRSRRRQRQLQASAAAAALNHHHQHFPATSCNNSTTTTSSSSVSSGGGFFSSTSTASSSSSSGFVVVGGEENAADDLFTISRQMGFGTDRMNNTYHQQPQVSSPFLYSSHQDFSQKQQLQYQPGLVTVFINGVATEVPKGPIDIRGLFGQDVFLVHSSGEVLTTNEYGIFMQGLQMGESYFLISRPT